MIFLIKRVKIEDSMTAAPPFVLQKYLHQLPASYTHIHLLDSFVGNVKRETIGIYLSNIIRKCSLHCQL